MNGNLKYNVKNPNQVMELLTNGQITPAEAFIFFRELDNHKNQIITRANDEEQLEDIMKELDDLIGLDKVKQLVKEIQAFVAIQKKRQEENLLTEPQVLHMIFKGNPGTGKTTVARLLGKMFKAMKILQKGHTVEVERADLVGEYIGHTAQKTREQIKRALGGILFIDEAYSLARGGEKDFGKEAIDTLVKAMEDHKDSLIVILAGYKDEMEWFLQTNPGLRSRFPIRMEFNDYTIDELMQIARMMVEKRQYKFSSEAMSKFEKILINSKNGIYYDKMGNARMVRNMIEKAIRRQAVRLVNQKKISREDLLYIKPEDVSEVEEA
ncbi:MAG: stage sporulation protein [Thermoanaerobacteraceae bacterium]|jgi:stage V sporulation protein K|uniref:Stage V sporulation protein K n=2 Tax=Biomaibacter acetigenes TaxID=2316383 RepID=A0A3G2R531_9FIRM|nr:stage V sporulation protein K [Biomaibacter acetigenes]MDK2878102.1 stage sporulation protein [Thermoanaerobacteraceae bacterium]RKL64129.1 stage V sporulation protein K [Thermoanaerobacteraceae bacterium SP2]AYO30556.1 stage V sporulation protein K [Biomaibacter acetigenes]MDN5302097.1 stage sporulation protein [Thermoanaerobacteraceae bacterium]MDN5311520.1 stage sporulation protein [Thermoanaerobacteraceae bacterium]